MGSAVEDLRAASGRRAPKTLPPPPPMASAVGDALPALARVARWRVGDRGVPPSRHELPRLPLAPGERHPLSAADPREQLQQRVMEAQRQAEAAHAAAAAESAARAAVTKHELVLLQDGDVDPLGVLGGAFTSLESASSGGASESLDDATTLRLKPDAAGSAAPSTTKKQAPETVKQQWKAHKDRVLAKFENVTFKIKANMLEARDLESEASWSSASGFQVESDKPGGVLALKKTRERLEELERTRRGNGSGSSSRRAGGDATVEMTQSEYVAKLRQMEHELVGAWNQNQKVAALRIAIKCVKLLSDTSSSPQLYPCVFVLVSDVLDTFGDLVFARIKARASEDENGQPLPTPLAESFVSSDVNIQAKETCRNWFYKTACIRELLPRIYIEVALLKSYRFLCDGEYPQIVSRLSNMIKCLLPPSDKTAVLSSVFDYMFTSHFFQHRSLDRWLEANGVTSAEYLGLHSPAVEWLLKCAASGAAPDAFETVVAHYREYAANSMVLKHVCEAFGPQCYAASPLAMLELVRTAAPSQVAPGHLYSLLALQLSASPTLAASSEGRLAFLNEAWAAITALDDLAQYIECAAAFMKLIVAHFSHREALILLKDVVRHVNAAAPSELTPTAYNLLGALIENVVRGAERHFAFFAQLIPSSDFLALMGLFKREASVGVAKQVLQAFVGAERQQRGRRQRNNNNSSNSGDNAVGSMRLHVVGAEAAVAHTLFVICCRVHDALDSLSTVSERADATADICAFIARLGGAVPETADAEDEALLMLYIDCRGAFYKLEPIKTTLTRAVLALAMRVARRGDRDRRGAKSRRNFIKSCLAYAHITIPSIAAPLRRLELLTLAATVALANNCLPQLDAFLKAAIIQIAELDPAAFLSASSSSAVVGGANDTGGGMSEYSSLMQPVDPDSLLAASATRTSDASALLRTVADLVSVLVYAPCLTDDDAFYFVDGLRKAALERIAWDALGASGNALPRVQVAATRARVRIRLWLLQLYGLWGQPRLLTRIPGVDSNDVLYGGDDGFAEAVHTHFSDVVEDLVRDVEALDALAVATVDVPLAQAELMLDFVNLVAPFLEQDEATSSAGDLLVSNSGGGSSRRRRRGRAGAVLVRKCMAFAHEKVRALSATATDAGGDTRLRVAGVHEYYDRTRQFMLALVGAQRARAPLLSDSSRQAISALEAALASS
ncbi:hypothetical protein PybrP1_009786 [[Pythium] brassicae (nom. inval.)]|nr:hypothetical protein PybrP1_009786 [[Pythium] brassicae (nom. inval.)]